MMNFKEEFENLKYYDLRLKQVFLEFLTKELFSINKKLINDSSLSSEKKINLLESLNDLLLDIINYSKLNRIENGMIEDLEIEINSLLKKTDYYSSTLKASLKNSFNSLNSLELSWEYELDIEPSKRFAIINGLLPFNIYSESKTLDRNRYKHFSDEEFLNLNQEFKSIINDINNENILSVDLNYAYANVLLPKAYDIIFDVKNPKRFWKQKTIIKCAFNFRDIFHMELWRGHSSHCLIEIIGGIPEIINELPDLTVKDNKFHNGIGFCTEYDWNYIKDN